MPISPNMGLNIPVVSTTPGPQYAQDVNASLNKLDVHNHTSGQGTQIPTAGLNINASLPMNNYGLLNTSQVSLASQALPPIIGSVYRNSADLYYVDGNGNNVRITQGGAVAVSGAVGFSGLPFGTAGASYNNLNQTFVFQSATNTAANVDCGSVILRELVAGAKGVTLSSPLALAADYTIRMPSGLPAATKIMQLASTGDITSVLGVDNSTIEISANNLQVKDLGITTAKLANNAVDNTKLSALSVATGNIQDSAVTNSKIVNLPYFQSGTINSSRQQNSEPGDISVYTNTLTTTKTNAKIEIRIDTIADNARLDSNGCDQAIDPGHLYINITGPGGYSSYSTWTLYNGFYGITYGVFRGMTRLLIFPTIGTYSFNFVMGRARGTNPPLYGYIIQSAVFSAQELAG